jgi:hypothetical protein
VGTTPDQVATTARVTTINHFYANPMRRLAVRPYAIAAL